MTNEHKIDDYWMEGRLQELATFLSQLSPEDRVDAILEYRKFRSRGGDLDAFDEFVKDWEEEEKESCFLPLLLHAMTLSVLPFLLGAIAGDPEAGNWIKVLFFALFVIICFITAAVLNSLLKYHWIKIRYQWVNERPKEPGWYWLRDGYNLSQVVHVSKDGHGEMIVAMTDTNDTWPLAALAKSYMWAGPIKRPFRKPTNNFIEADEA